MVLGFALFVEMSSENGQKKSRINLSKESAALGVVTPDCQQDIVLGKRLIIINRWKDFVDIVVTQN